MDELCCNESGMEEWKETARWLKFEEDVEEGGNRWSKPHVATLSLYSLFELRSCVLNGTVLLDLNATTISQIAGKQCCLIFIIQYQLSCEWVLMYSNSVITIIMIYSNNYQGSVYTVWWPEGVISVAQHSEITLHVLRLSFWWKTVILQCICMYSLYWDIKIQQHAWPSLCFSLVFFLP